MNSQMPAAPASKTLFSPAFALATAFAMLAFAAPALAGEQTLAAADGAMPMQAQTGATGPRSGSGFKCTDGHKLIAQFSSPEASVIVDVGDGPHELALKPW